MLAQLPPELLVRVISYVQDIGDKCQLLATCKQLHDFLCSHVSCWSNLDLSPFDDRINNNSLLLFLKTVNIPLYTSFNQSGKEDHTKSTITRLDLSGCWNLSDDLIVTLSKSLVNLNELYLNGYRLNPTTIRPRRRNDTPPIAFEQQRDHVYQVRPSHDLSSMAMDLSKKSSHRLKVHHVLLSTILNQLQHVTSLSIQYQDLSCHDPRAIDLSGLKHLKHLDISSCIATQPLIQILLRKIGPNLVSLKMLNMDLNNLTWLCVREYGKKLTCLHVSCSEPVFLPSVKHAVAGLLHLRDFRLTRIRTGVVDEIIQQLPRHLLKRLDLSPKMNIYPKSPSSSTNTQHRGRVHLNTTTSSTANSRKHPPQSPKILSIASYATLEHDLLFRDYSLLHLSQCKQLIELRLCFPDISPNALEHMFESIPQLQVFELRQKKKSRADYLKGLRFCQNLQELVLFGVKVTKETMDIMLCKDYALQHTLHHVTLSDSGNMIEQHFQSMLSGFSVLQTLCLGRLVNPFPWDEPVNDRHNVIIYKKPNEAHWYIQ